MAKLEPIQSSDTEAGTSVAVQGVQSRASTPGQDSLSARPDVSNGSLHSVDHRSISTKHEPQEDGDSGSSGGWETEGSGSIEMDDSDVDEDAQYELVDAEPPPQQTATQAPPTPTPRHKNGGRRKFILRRARAHNEAQMKQRLDDHPDRYDYEKKYPADRDWHEMGPNARVWRVYLDEAGAYDGDMIENYKDTVDVILVFAGLFSAVVTTLAVEAAQALQPDYSQVVASILLQQLIAQRAATSGEVAPDTLPSALSLDTFTSSPSPSDLWVSGLWYTSLAFSLSTALIGVLVKQWIQAYAAPVSGPPRAQARLRQYRFTGLDKWHVPLIIGLLPTLLHLSLLLFLVGLVVYLFNLDHVSATVVASITFFFYTVYGVTNLLPLFDSQCPYKTPLSTYSYALFHPYIPVIKSLLYSVAGVASSLQNFVVTHIRSFVFAVHFSFYATGRLLRLSHHDHPRSSPTPDLKSPSPKVAVKNLTLRSSELSGIQTEADQVDARSLSWLATTSSNPSVSAIIIQALTGIREGFKAKDILREEGVPEIVCAELRYCFDEQGDLRGELPDDRFISCAVAHRRLGLDFDNGGVPIFTCTDEHTTQPDRTCQALYQHYMIGLELEDLHRSIGALLCFPDPAYAAETYHSLINAGWLHTIREAAIFHRGITEKTAPADWVSFYKLLQLMHFDAPEDDLHALKEVLVPIYLSSQVAPMLPGEPKIISSLLLDNGAFTISEEAHQLWLISFGFYSSFIAGALHSFRKGELKEPLKSEWWEELGCGLQRLANAAQKYRERLDPDRCEFPEWLSASVRSLVESLEGFLQGSERQSLPTALQSSFAISAILVNPAYIDLPRLPFKMYPELLRLVIQGLENPNVDEKPLSCAYPVATRCQALCILLNEPLGPSSTLEDIFKTTDVFSIFQRIFSADAREGACLASCADVFLQQISQHVEDGNNEKSSSSDYLEYIFDRLSEICTWYSSCEWNPRSGLCSFLRCQPPPAVWDRAVMHLRTRELSTDDEKRYGSAFIDQLERQIKAERNKVRGPVVSTRETRNIPRNRGALLRGFGRLADSFIDGLTRRPRRGPIIPVADASVSEAPFTELEAREYKDPHKAV